VLVLCVTRLISDPEVVCWWCVAQAEAQKDLRAWLHSVFWALSGDSPYGTWMEQLQATSGSDLLSTLPSPPDTLPEWLTEGDLSYYVEQFTANGMGGPISWYRNFGEWYEISDELEHSSVSEKDGSVGPQRFEMPAGFLYGSDSDIMSFDPNWEEGNYSSNQPLMCNPN
jgi:hypothetical protein